MERNEKQSNVESENRNNSSSSLSLSLSSSQFSLLPLMMDLLCTYSNR